MAKVAFDVQGTLIGPYQAQVVQLFNILEQRGHELFVWSFGGYSMALSAARSLKLKAEPMDKVTRNFDADKQLMDVCVDDEDTAEAVLSADRMIDVRNIPGTMPELLEFLKDYNL